MNIFAKHSSLAVLIILTAFCILLVPALVDYLKPSFRPNRGSNLLAVKQTVDALARFTVATGRSAYSDVGWTNLSEYGLTDDVLKKVTIFRPQANSAVSDPRTIVVVAIEAVELAKHRRGKYVGLASGAVVVVPEKEAILGGVVSNAVPSGL